MTETTKWKYYDFTNKWEEFYNIWSSEEVQIKLTDQMESWCETEAYFTAEGKKPLWIPNSDLWTYSRTDYHYTQIMNKANDYVLNNNIVKTYGNTMSRLGFKYSKDSLSEKFFQSKCYEEIERSFEPKANSQEANILMMGCNYLIEPLLTAGQILFRDNDVIAVETEDGKNDIVVIPNMKLIFDFNRQYHYVNECEELSPEKLCEEFKFSEINY